MGSYLDMQTRIANELDRSDLTAEIKKAIVTAVELYERRRFYFCESRFTFATVSGQEVYTSDDAAAIAISPSIERLSGTFNGTRRPLTKRPWSYIDDISPTTATRAQPFDWGYRAKAIRLYPIPDAAYTLTAYNVPRLTALSADGDTNAWTEDAEELIRTHAKLDLLRNVIRGVDMVEEIALLQNQERDAFTALINETASREATGFSQPTCF